MMWDERNEGELIMERVKDNVRPFKFSHVCNQQILLTNPVNYEYVSVLRQKPASERARTLESTQLHNPLHLLHLFTLQSVVLIVV